MQQNRYTVAGWKSLMMAGMVALAASAMAAKPPHHPSHVQATGSRAAALAVVSQFEQAYEHRDKNTMLMKLMVPTNDQAALEKRYQWLRGYGPKDLPGSVHPPILFDHNRGSFVPTSYKVAEAAPEDPSHWQVTVKEEGTYQDEDGHYHVSRIRHFKMTNYKGRWYVMDYYLQENPEDYGFFVDDISDKMT